MIDYEVIGNGVTSIYAGPITSRDGAFLVDIGLDVTDQVVFDNSGEGSLILGFNSVPGDVNLDGVVDALDIAPFIDHLILGSYQAEADINQDGVVDALDIYPLVGGGLPGGDSSTAVVPEPVSLLLTGLAGLLLISLRKRTPPRPEEGGHTPYRRSASSAERNPSPCATAG